LFIVKGLNMSRKVALLALLTWVSPVRVVDGFATGSGAVPRHVFVNYKSTSTLGENDNDSSNSKLHSAPGSPFKLQAVAGGHGFQESECEHIPARSCRRVALRTMLGSAATASAAMLLGRSSASAADGEGMNVDEFLRKGMVSMPMGVSGQAGKSRPQTGVILRCVRKVVFRNKFNFILMMAFLIRMVSYTVTTHTHRWCWKTTHCTI
jgi:hypothetical protein